LRGDLLGDFCAAIGRARAPITALAFAAAIAAMVGPDDGNIALAEGMTVVVVVVVEGASIGAMFVVFEVVEIDACLLLSLVLFMGEP
jgi:hypothetical protein